MACHRDPILNKRQEGFDPTGIFLMVFEEIIVGWRPFQLEMVEGCSLHSSTLPPHIPI
jgi:hypothetical protein